MHVYTRRQGGHFRLGDAIEVEVAEINAGKVKLALTTFESGEIVAADVHPRLVRATGSGYYLFRSGERPTLFTSIYVGKPVNIAGRFNLTILHVDRRGVTIAAVGNE
jgi:sRNA-binding carbon storage regulator CsrA